MTTKYDIGQQLWFMVDNTPKQMNVDRILIRPSGFVTSYFFNAFGCNKIEVHESKCFLTKKDLLESL